MVENNQELLEILQTHGQQFLNSFSRVPSPKKRRRNASDSPEGLQRKRTSQEPPDLQDEEEWRGIEGLSGDDYTDGDQSPCLNFEQDDDDFTGESSSLPKNVIVFRDSSSNKTLPDKVSKAQVKAFMSSKVSKVRQDIPNTLESKMTAIDREDERSNAQNDALLHRLVHTKILSGSLSTELDLTPAQRRKALAGRVLELSGGAKLGKGENSVRDIERNKAAKRVREGIIEKQKERRVQELEEAKNMGNYHPTIKKLFESSRGRTIKKRDKGLRMGVGKFNGGILKLSREDISIAEGGAPGPRGSHRGGRGRSTGRRAN